MTRNGDEALICQARRDSDSSTSTKDGRAARKSPTTTTDEGAKGGGQSETFCLRRRQRGACAMPSPAPLTLSQKCPRNKRFAFRMGGERRNGGGRQLVTSLVLQPCPGMERNECMRAKPHESRITYCVRATQAECAGKRREKISRMNEQHRKKS